MMVIKWLLKLVDLVVWVAIFIGLILLIIVGIPVWCVLKMIFRIIIYPVSVVCAYAVNEETREEIKNRFQKNFFAGVIYILWIPIREFVKIIMLFGVELGVNYARVFRQIKEGIEED